MIHLDTHVLVWLYSRQRGRIPVATQQLIEGQQVAISPIVELEMKYLLEVGKMSVPPQTVLDEMVPVLGLGVSDSSFHSVISEALKLNWTRDPFDRLIAAHAIVDDARLLTADQHLLKHLPRAMWGDAPGPDGT